MNYSLNIYTDCCTHVHNYSRVVCHMKIIFSMNYNYVNSLLNVHVHIVNLYVNNQMYMHVNTTEINAFNIYSNVICT